MSRYPKFKLVNGSHPLRETLPNSYVLYPARKLDGGQVTYFNFRLAKEMGLIPTNHKEKMNKELEAVILDAFCIQILNEFDQENTLKVSPQKMMPNKYMATRYLQLQHENKQGKTSGDGRGVWNGIVRSRGVTWDIFSRGTGVTCLAPGSVIAEEPLKTGDESIGYSCGLVEIDELYSSTLMSETFHLKGIKTERMLCIIETKKGIGIGVRAAPNLLRPAHLFRLLRLNQFEELKAGTDYLIRRQYENGEWDIKPRSPKRYSQMVEQITKDFSEFAALLEREYIFTWLDWDGDNVLSNAAILDYGCIRQFGLRHDKYRYDDVHRYSINLNEQRQKARLIVQNFAQIANFLETNVKKPLKDFASHPCCLKFDQNFEDFYIKHLLFQSGFVEKDVEKLMTNYKPLVLNFINSFDKLERVKSAIGPEEIPDGVNHPAIFDMRKLLALLPIKYMLRPVDYLEPSETLLTEIIVAYHKKDFEYSKSQLEHMDQIQTTYKELVLALDNDYLKKLNELATRSVSINREDRLTGNAVTVVIKDIMNRIKKGLKPQEIQNLLDQFIDHQAHPPGKGLPQEEKIVENLNSSEEPAFKRYLKLISSYRHDV